MSNWSKVAELADLVPGRGIGLELDGELVGLYLVDGRVYALGDVCTHAYALLSNGFVLGNEVECPLHFARFDLATGACVEGPALDDVPSLPVNVEEGTVYLDLDALRSMNRTG